ncbi:unnamed protein product, partial [Urochloa humidicola]
LPPSSSSDVPPSPRRCRILVHPLAAASSSIRSPPPRRARSSEPGPGPGRGATRREQGRLGRRRAGGLDNVATRGVVGTALLRATRGVVGTALLRIPLALLSRVRLSPAAMPSSRSASSAKVVSASHTDVNPVVEHWS